MTIQARFSSICPKCNRRIQTGERVNWQRGQKAEHINCGNAQAEAEFRGTQCTCGYETRVGDKCCPVCGANIRDPLEEAEAKAFKPGTLVAKYRSMCGVCQSPILPGALIIKPVNARSVHAYCAGDRFESEQEAEAHAARTEPIASREEQQARYIDAGPQAWDDRDPEPGDDFDF